MAYWIFQANPKKYRLVDALTQLDDIHWQVNQHVSEIHPGDGVLIWKAGDNAGVYAVGEVQSEPSMTEALDAHWEVAQDQENTAVRLRVRVHITHRLMDGPVLRNTLLEDPLLEGLSILRFTQGTNFPVSLEEWNRLLALAGLAHHEDEHEETEHRLDVAETHLRQAIARNLAQIEPDLVPYFDDRVEEYPIPGGRIDLLCRDGSGQPVVVELKRQHWDAYKAVGQIARYMGWASQTLAGGEPVRGILLILNDGTDDQRLHDATAALPGLEVRRYSITLKVE